jgi:ankyrin repeat protein
MKSSIYDVFLAGATKENLQAKLDVLLHVACDEGNLDLVKYVLTSDEIEKHAIITSEGNKALINACSQGHLEIVKYLLTSNDLKKHANINAQDGKVLDYACFKGHLEVVRFLTTSEDLKKKIDINKNIVRNFGYTLEGGNSEVITYFIVDLNIEKTQGVERALKSYPNKQAEKLFELRKVNKELQSELNIATDNKKFKIKL